MTQTDLDDTTLSNFEIHDNVLTANVDLYWENHAEFRKKCDELLSSDAEKVVLDLTQVNFIFSAYMGTIGRLLADTAKHNKHLVIRVAPNLRWLFEIVGFEKMIEIEVVG